MNSGHIHQLSALEKLVQYCYGFGDAYQPFNHRLQLTALQLLLDNARASMAAVQTARTHYVQMVNARQDEFNRLTSLVTRIVNSYAMLSVSSSNLEDVYRLVRKLRRSKASISMSHPEDETDDQGKTRIQSDYHSRVGYFAALVKQIKVETGYQPNETDITVEALERKVMELEALNHAIMNAQIELSNARHQRDRILYQEYGVHHTALKVKQYIIASAGYQSEAHNLIKGIRFVNNAR